jgi:hypothetical protein
MMPRQSLGCLKPYRDGAVTRSAEAQRRTGEAG